MSKEELYICRYVAWVITCAVCWYCGYRGYSSYPRFDMWFWGIACLIDLMTLGGWIALWRQ
jgi:hypothetical protein